MEIVKSLITWVASFAATPYGAWALFGVAFAESSFFPVPPDVLLIALALARPEGALWFAAVCTAGSVLGGCFGYAIGRYGGRPLLQRLFAPHKIALVQHYFQKYDVWAVGIAAFSPIPYKVFTIAAGVFLLDVKRFTVVSIAGRGGRFFAVGGLFYFFGEPIAAFIAKYFEMLTVGFVVLLLGGFWVVHRVSKRKMTQGCAPGKDGAQGP